MLLKRIYDDNLAQASYLIGCPATGEAIIVDANRDVQQYVRAAADDDLRITHVSETHIHADFVSGSRELAHITGAKLLLSDEGGPDWLYAFAKESGATLVHDGDTFMVGNLRFEVMHTPGHTPEHISFLVTDTPATDKAMGALTGDFLFVGDVGRPDLLEKAAKIVGTMEAGARTLFGSLERFKQLPDYIQVWPGHGAGSACGKALGAVPFSTLGYEKIANWGLRIDNEADFVEEVLRGQPEPPRYFAEMKRINRIGPRLLGGFNRPPVMDPASIDALLRDGTVVVDTRAASEYAAGHVPRTINIPLNKSFTTWAGWLVPFDVDFYLIAEEGRIDEVVKDLSMIGLDQVAGRFDTAVVGSRRDLETISRISADDLARRMAHDEVTVLDIRGRSEWEAGHLPGVENIPLGYLADRIASLPALKPVVVHCESGSRSAIAASILQAGGMKAVLNYSGGYSEWVREKRPVQREESPALVS